MKLVFEKGANGRHLSVLPHCDVPAFTPEDSMQRSSKPRLPHMSETEISRHYTQMAGRTHGVNDGFYPLGSCTMKYNPKVNEEAAALPGFKKLHPLQPLSTAQGALEVLWNAERLLCEITGMDAMTFEPAAAPTASSPACC